MSALSSTSLIRPGRVIILGGSGFLGRNLAAKLAIYDINVVSIGSSDIDLTDPHAGNSLADRLRSDDAVVFMSAITPDKGRDSSAFVRNLAMGKAVLEAISAVRPRHLTYASSDAVYSFANAAISEGSLACPLDLYGAMHRAREISLAAESRTPLMILRFTAIFGVGDTHNSYGPNRFIYQALGAKKITIIGNGEETRDHLYINDAVEITCRAVLSGRVGILNVASGSSVSFRELSEQIAALCPGTEIETSQRRSNITFRRFDTQSIAEAFPDFRATPIQEGLRSSIAAWPPNGILAARG